MPQLLRKAWFWVAMAALGIASVVCYVVATVDGLQIHRIDSGSMGDVLPKGSVIITYQVNDLKPNDIITFREPKTGQVITHTFGGYDKQGNLMTKGEANPSPDRHSPPLRPEHVIGKVASYHLETPTADLLASKRGVAGLTLFGAAVFALIAGLYMRRAEGEKFSGQEAASNPV